MNLHTNSSDLAGKVAIVTGGGRGIGRAIAETLSADGARVAISARSVDQLDETVNSIRDAGGHALAFPLDVTDSQAVKQMVDAVEEQLGPVDLLVNNAGITGPAGPLWALDTDEWWHCLNVNLRGALLCAQRVLPSMIARRKGCIVNMSSGAANGPWPNVSAYAVSKAALDRFSENLALEALEHNISVFAVSPGLVRTAMTDRASTAEWQKWDNRITELFAEGVEVPVDRIVALVRFIVSGAADILSGCHISVHDDVAAMVQQATEIKQGALYKLRTHKLPA